MNSKGIIPLIMAILAFSVHAVYFKSRFASGMTLIGTRWLSSFYQSQQYFYSFSYAVALGFGAFSFLRMRGTRSRGSGKGAMGGAVLPFFIWFTSCCGAPALAIVLGAGAASIILPPPVTFLATVALVSLGFAWLVRQGVHAKLVCGSCKEEMEVPVVHCGPGIRGPEEGRLYCPCLNEGHTENIEIPKHCGEPMKYVI